MSERKRSGGKWPDPLYATGYVVHGGPINAVLLRMRRNLVIAGRVIKAIVWKAEQRALCRLIKVIYHRTTMPDTVAC